MTSQEVVPHFENATSWTLEYHVSLWYESWENVSLRLRPARDSPFEEPEGANWNRIYDLEKSVYYTMRFDVAQLAPGIDNGSLVLDFRAARPDTDPYITRWLITAQANGTGGWTITTDDTPSCTWGERCWWDPDDPHP